MKLTLYINLLVWLWSGALSAQTTGNRKNAVAFVNKGLVFEKKNPGEAIRYFTKAIKEDSTYEDAYRQRAASYFNKGDFENGVKDCHWLDQHHFDYVLDNMFGLNTNSSPGGVVKTEQERYSESEKFYNTAIRLYPEEGRYFAGFGLFYFEPHSPESLLVSRFDKAAEMLENAVNLNYASTEIYSKLGYCLMQMDENKRAIIYLSKAIETDPGNIDNFFNRGNAFLAIHQLQAAIDDYNICLQNDSTNPYLWYNLGHAQYGLNDFAASIISLKKTLDIQPGFEDTWFRLGLSYGDNGDFQNAVNAFSEAIKQYPGEAYLYYNRAVAKAKADPKSEYCADLKTAADMGYADAKKMQEKLCKP